jgi:NAD-dependent dihydropyrimidine dehydrogenase PreA subunit
MKYLRDATTLGYAREKCTGCGRCVEVCPHGVFVLTGKQVVVVERDRCIECGACMNNCEPGALSVDAGVGCAAALLNSMVRGGEPACGCGDSEIAG